jgi:hypothetical protein
VKLKGRAQAPDWSRGCTLSSRTRGDTNDCHGTLQRLLDASHLVRFRCHSFTGTAGLANPDSKLVLAVWCGIQLQTLRVNRRHTSTEPLTCHREFVMPLRDRHFRHSTLNWGPINFLYHHHHGREEVQRRVPRYRRGCGWIYCPSRINALRCARRERLPTTE